MPQRPGQGTKESRPPGEEIHAVSLQQPGDHFFHGGVQMSKCQIKFGKQRAAGRKPNSFLQKSTRKGSVYSETVKGIQTDDRRVHKEGKGVLVRTPSMAFKKKKKKANFMLVNA